MTAEPIDFAAVKAEHEKVGEICRKCLQSEDGYADVVRWPCDAYRLAVEAERLAGERDEAEARLWHYSFANVERERDEARAEAERANAACLLLGQIIDRKTEEVERLAEKVARVETLVGEADKASVTSFSRMFNGEPFPTSVMTSQVRAALADQLEQVQPNPYARSADA